VIYLDTDAMIGAYVEADQYHARAQRAFERLLRDKRARLYTSDVVLWELANYFFYNAPAKNPAPAIHFAVDRLRHLRTWPRLEVVTPTAQDHLAALEDFQNFGDHPISLADCLSFAIMRRLGIPRVLSFDHHFRVAGFDIVAAQD